MPLQFPVTSHAGTALVGILDVPEVALSGPLEHPLTHALVVARHGGRHLLVLNRWRGRWELPGGVIEPGETPRAAAARELEEETGQCAGSLAYRGLMHVRFPDGRSELGALYAAALDQLRPFAPNDESERIALWDGREDIGAVEEIDAALLGLG